MGQNISYSPITRYCGCGEQFSTNFYGHESKCPKCKKRKKRKEFFRSPIKMTIRKIIEWSEK